MAWGGREAHRDFGGGGGGGVLEVVGREGGNVGEAWWTHWCGCVDALSSRTPPGGARLAAVISTTEQLRSPATPSCQGELINNLRTMKNKNRN